MLTGFVLVVIAVLCRLASSAFHWWNFVPMGAIALYAGARLPRRWAWLVPVSAMVFADLITNDGYRVTPNKATFTKESLATISNYLQTTFLLDGCYWLHFRIQLQPLTERFGSFRRTPLASKPPSAAIPAQAVGRHPVSYSPDCDAEFPGHP